MNANNGTIQKICGLINYRTDNSEGAQKFCASARRISKVAGERIDLPLYPFGENSYVIFSANWRCDVFVYGEHIGTIKSTFASRSGFLDWVVEKEI